MSKAITHEWQLLKKDQIVPNGVETVAFCEGYALVNVGELDIYCPLEHVTNCDDCTQPGETCPLDSASKK